MAADYPPPLTKNEINQLFIQVDPPGPNTFELALVLGGTVSAGAYPAGAVDFLIEALDCLSKAQQEKSAPHHRVRLKLIAVTSGGGVNAAIASRALAYDYPHVTRATPPGTTASSNPFYDTWINILRLDGFLEISDVGKGLKSLFNGW